MSNYAPSLRAIKEGGVWVTTPREVLGSIRKFYEALYDHPTSNREEWGERHKHWWESPHKMPKTLRKEASWEEFLKVLRTKGKAPGADQVPMEAIAHAPREIQKDVFHWVNKVIVENVMEKSEALGRGRMLYKKGCRGDPNNYRLLTVQNIGYRIVTAIIAARLQKMGADYHLLQPQQGGFQADKQMGWMATLAIMATELARKWNKESWLAYVDVWKAFDQVDRSLLYEMLDLKGLDKEDVDLIKFLTDNPEMYIETDLGNMEKMTLLKGVRQGCALSPWLFNVYVDGLLKAVHTTGEGVNWPITGKKVSVLGFADDIALVSTHEIGSREVPRNPYGNSDFSRAEGQSGQNGNFRMARKT